MTPEGKVKRKVTKLLGFYEVLYFMPVQNGYGGAALDYICCHQGKYFQIEVKAHEKVMTPRQHQIAEAVRRAGGDAFLINEDPKTMEKLESWLESASE